MADVADRTETRGQLLIIAAVGLAVLLVVLALALNTAVFGGVHVAATDDGLREEQGAIQYQNGVERGVEGFLPLLPNETDTYENLTNELEDEFDEELTDWDGLAKREYARDGVATNASVAGVDFGTYIIHDDESRNFTNANSTNTTWTVAENVSTVRSFEMNVSGEELAETDDCASSDECFSLTVDGGAWNLSAYKNTSDGNVTIEINGTESTVKCSTNETNVGIDLTEGTFDATGCEGFTTFQEDLEAPYTLNYTTADRVNGTYELLVDEELDSDDYHEPETGKSPRRAPSVVAAAVTVRYQSADLTYQTEIRVAPDDSDG